jgi:hypothetical protein
MISSDGYWMWNGTQWVPNPYRPAAAPPMVRPYEPGTDRARLTSIMLAITIASSVLLMAASVALDLTPESNQDSYAELAVGVGLTALLFVGVFIATAVFFCMWLHRVVRNMPALGSTDPRWSPARSVVYCFIPFIWLVHPLWSVLDAWRGADPSGRWLNGAARKSISPPGLFAAWWATWLIGNFAFNGSSRLTGTPAAVLEVLGGLFTVAAGWLCILVVREVTARQERKNQLIATGQLV